MKLARRILIYVLLSTLFVLFAVDAMLWRIDPAGIVTFQEDYRQLQEHSTPAPDGERFAMGHYQMRHYSVDIDASGFRAVPESRGGACVIAFLGDSVSFAIGSQRSFINFLAPDIDATVLSRAIPGYNIDNIEALLNTVEADGFIWLTFSNDDGSPFVWHPVTGGLSPALYLYSAASIYREPEPPRLDYYRAHLAPILARDDVLSFAFEGERLADIAEEYGALPIEMYHERVSSYDGHPTSEEHERIANEMRPYVIPFTDRICNQKSAP